MSPEIVLPRVSCHSIKLMNSPCIVVACICLEKLASAEVPASCISSYAEVVRIGISLKRSRPHTIVGFRTGDVKSCAYIEAEGFESMYLVIGRHPADEPSGQGEAEVVIKHGKRARSDEDIRRKVDSTAVSVVPVAVGRGVVDAAVLIPPVRIPGRVEEGRLAYGTSVRVVGIRDDSLGADVKAQMLVQEVRSKVKVQCTSIIAGFLEGSLLAVVGHGSPVRHPVLQISVETHIVLRS